MDPAQLTLSPEAYNAHLLRGVIESTAVANETAVDAQTRSGVIIELFRCFAPCDAMESMVACHCVTLQFMFMAAMRDAGSADLDPKQAARMRASAMSISKQLHVWVTKFETLRARSETPADEPPPKPSPGRSHRTGSVSEKPSTRPEVTSGRPDFNPFDQPDLKAMPFRSALLATTQLVRGVRPDGTMSGQAPPPAG